MESKAQVPVMKKTYKSGPKKGNQNEDASWPEM